MPLCAIRIYLVSEDQQTGAGRGGLIRDTNHPKTKDKCLLLLPLLFTNANTGGTSTRRTSGQWPMCLLSVDQWNQSFCKAIREQGAEVHAAINKESHWSIIPPSKGQRYFVFRQGELSDLASFRIISARIRWPLSEDTGGLVRAAHGVEGTAVSRITQATKKQV